MVCASCGAENPEGFRFCGSCGAAFVPASHPREVRKVVTVLFCDLSGSTALGDRTDPEALRATMRSYYEGMRAILERHGGTVEKFVGDAVMAVFGVPVAHEDDALRAVRAAWEMRAAVPALGLAARIGVNSGEVVAGEGDTLVTGDAVNVAARLEQGAAAGEVLIGSETRRLVRNAVECEPVAVEAKGKGAVEAFRLLAVDLEAPAVARHLDAPLVGRERELETLRQAADRSVRESSCHLFTLLGTAGVGKSRLVAEFLAGLAPGDTVIRGRCLDYGEGITFWPVVEALKQLGPRSEATIDGLVAGAASPNEVFLAIRRLLEEVARERPLVVIFDDIHWGEPIFLDLIDHVADLSRGAPILLLCLARPELLDERPAWGGGKLNATTLLLEPLSADECGRLVDELDGGVDAETRARIVATADGNPLFAEEMLALALDGGDIRVPSTIQALLQARLDRLGSDERTVIERGAVEGQVFHQSAVRALAPEAARDGVERSLVGLVRKELIRPDRPQIAGDDAFRFRHLLVRDAAYESLPKETRAELHARFADWLEQRAELVELDEIVGYHLEQAAVYRGDLGRENGDVAARAAVHLASAGRAALGRSDLHAASNLLERALALAPAGVEAEWATLALADALHGLGLQERALELLEPLARSRDTGVRAQARVLAPTVRITSDPQSAIAEAEAVLGQVLPELERAGDDAGLARTRMLEASIHWHGARAEHAARASRLAMEHARRAGDLRLRAVAAYMTAAAVAWGPSGPHEMEAVIEELEQQHGDSPTALAGADFIRAMLLLNRGDFEGSERVAREHRARQLELGEEVLANAAYETTVIGLRWQGNLDEALRAGDHAYRRLRELGGSGFASTVAIHVAEVLYARGDLDAAERLAVEGEQLGSVEDTINLAMGRIVRARVAADKGDVERAAELAREGVRYSLETHLPLIQGDAYRALAYVSRACGRPDDERAALEQALAAYRRKEIVPMIRETERLLAATRG